jgi:hypothetical protein
MPPTSDQVLLMLMRSSAIMQALHSKGFTRPPICLYMPL